MRHNQKRYRLKEFGLDDNQVTAEDKNLALRKKLGITFDGKRLFGNAVEEYFEKHPEKGA